MTTNGATGRRRRGFVASTSDHRSMSLPFDEYRSGYPQTGTEPRLRKRSDPFGRLCRSSRICFAATAGTRSPFIAGIDVVARGIIDRRATPA